MGWEWKEKYRHVRGVARDRHRIGVGMERKVLSREGCFARDRHRVEVGIERKVLLRERCFARDRHRVELGRKVLSRNKRFSRGLSAFSMLTP
jgi:hypothetical protein